MKRAIIHLILIFISFLAYSQNGNEYAPYYKIEGEKHERKIFYEKIIDFEGLSSQNILEGAKKFLLINSAKITYEGKDEIYAMGTFSTRSRYWFLFFYSTKKYDAVYDIIIKIKEGKLKYRLEYFYLIPQWINSRTYNWFSGTNNYGWSTTKIPQTVVKYPLEIHYPRKTHKRNILFYDLDEKVKTFENKLISTIKNDNDEWGENKPEIWDDNKLDQVKLNNGSIIKCKIISADFENIKLKTSDGTIKTYKMSEIETYKYYSN